jgi:vitamin B12 transporter
MRKIFVVAAIIFSSHSFAQSVDDSSQTMDPVIITANKLPQKQSTTGKMITVISKEQIEKNAGRTLTQLLNEQAGIIVNGANNVLGANQSMYVRGASSGRTLVLIDGIPINDPTLINNEVDLNLFSLNNIERIEICQGAQSTLYGSDAVAGVVNIITVKNNITKPASAKATLSGGNHNTFRANAQVYGKEGKLTYTTRFARLSTDGFSSAYDTTGKKGFDKDGYKGNAAHVALQFAENTNLSFKGFIQYNQYKADLDASTFTDEKDFTVNNKNLISGGGFRFTKNGITLTGNYQYSQTKRLYLNDSIDVPGFTKYSTDNYKGRNHFVELFSSVIVGKNFTLLQGGDYRYSQMNSQYYSLSSFGPFTSSFKDTSYSQASLYASLLYHSINEKMNIEAGGRLNVHSRYGSNKTYTFNPSFGFSQHFRLFGSIASAFKAPSLFQLYSSSSGNSDLKPETSTTYEAGLQQTHAMIQSRFVYFHRDIKNGLDFNYVNFKYFNFLKQKVDGIEAEASLQPIKGLTISANYTYLSSGETTQSRIDFKDTTYSYLLRRPKHNVNLIAAYQFANGFYFSATGKYLSTRYDVGGYKKSDVLLDTYFLLNAYTEYTFKKHLKVFINAQNIMNKKFFDIYGYNSIPFLINVGASFNWE